jgi:hypothetical protein
MTALSKTAAKPALRFGAVYVPNGIVMQDWTPAAEGAAFELPPILQPLAPFRDQLLVLTGLNSAPPPGAGSGGVHSRASTRFLTDIQPADPEKWNERFAVSMDQLIARELGKQTELASIEIGMEGADFAGSCDSGGFSCAFTYTISWRDARTPLPMEHNPRAVFERLFGDNESTDPKARIARIREQRSILDSVIQDITRLRHTLDSSDGAKIEGYVDAIRDVERRIQMAEAHSDREVPLVPRPVGVPASFSDHAGLMYDLMLLGFQADRTRVATFMCGHELSGRTYPEIEVPDAHHPLSHHQGVPEALAKLTKINTYHTRLFGSFVEKLRSTPDGDGSLLDHIVIVYGSGMSDSNAHSPFNLPILVLGGGGGQIRGGRHLRYPKGTPLANLHVSLLEKLGVRMDRMGDSTGPLPYLSGDQTPPRLSGF